MKINKILIFNLGIIALIYLTFLKSEINLDSFNINKINVKYENNMTLVYIDGLLINSALGIYKIESTRNGNILNITLYQTLALKKYSGRLHYENSFAGEIDAITFGSKNYVIWQN